MLTLMQLAKQTLCAENLRPPLVATSTIGLAASAGFYGGNTWVALRVPLFQIGRFVALYPSASLFFDGERTGFGLIYGVGVRAGTQLIGDRLRIYAFVQVGAMQGIAGATVARRVLFHALGGVGVEYVLATRLTLFFEFGGGRDLHQLGPQFGSSPAALATGLRVAF
jgi:hypothetical protein